MKNSLKDLKLWQQKRNELKVDANPDMDWSDMNSLLDQHMPVSPNANPSNGGSGSSGSGGGAAGASGLAKLGGIIGLSTAVVAVTVYVASHFVGDKTDKKQADSLSKANIEQKISGDSLITSKDTSFEAYQPLTDSAKLAANKDSVRQDLAERNTRNEDETVAKAANGNDPANTSASVNNSAIKGGSNNTMSKNDASKPVSGAREGGVAHGAGRNSVVSNNNSKTIGGASANRSLNGVRGNSGRNGRSGWNGRDNAATGGGDKLLSNGNKLQNGLGKNKPLNNVDPQDNASAISFRNSAAELNIANNWYDRTVQSLFINKLTEPQHAIASPGTGGWSPVGNNIRALAEKQKADKVKNKKERSAGSGNFDWGILAGINTAKSFDRKVIDTNKNTALQVDFYAGVYGTYYFNPKWGIGAQLWVNNPQKISGGYAHANGSKVDSGKVIQVTDSRKAYFVTLPIQAVYRLNNNFNVKLGPVLNIPIRQTPGSTSLTPTTINGDTVYFGNAMSQLSETRFDQKISFGIAGGLQYQYGRFGIEAGYLKNLSGFNVTSSYGTYRMTDPGTLHITIGFRLNRARE